MKVVHMPIEIAGQMGILSKGLGKFGIPSAAYNTFHSYLNYRDDVYNLDVYELEWMLQPLIDHFDLFHFHYGSSLLPNYTDLPLLAQAGKAMVMHHWGNDVRTHLLATRRNPFAYTGDSPPAEQIDVSLKTMSRYIRHAIVQDYEVFPYVVPYYEHVHVLPISMDVHAWSPSYPDSECDEPLIVHAPTNPLFKGTAHIESTIRRLREDGLSFCYRRIEHMSNVEAMQLYKQADIIVDQVLCGSYGLLCVEAMSLGKPVVSYLHQEILPLYPALPPIVSANPSTLDGELRKLITNSQRRVEVGKRGRLFAEQVHDIRRVIPQLIHIYDQIERDV